MQSDATIDIIIPVYNAREATLDCLHSVMNSLPLLHCQARILVVYDAGPDDQLLDELQTMAAAQQITLLINEHNLGFVHSANRGMAHGAGRDVVLLNSDTVVANDWLDRLHAAAHADRSTGTVTPFSNNAEICSWPRLCQDNPLPEGYTVQEVDRAFADLGATTVDLPTAVGFCMYVRRDCLERTGLFNAAVFGRGYGEENDFCLRAAKLGFRHVLACNVFVYHMGGASFGAEKQASIRKALNILDHLYPDYAARVSQHIAEDPAGKWRFAAELSLRRQRARPLILHLSHGIGGGTDKHVIELCRHSRDIFEHAMLVPQSESLRLVFPNVVSGGLFEFPDAAMDELALLLQALGLARVHVHHVKGWERRIGKLLRLLDMPCDVTLHDYYYIHPNPALADAQGRFCMDDPQRDRLWTDAIAFPDGYDAKSWRHTWGSFLERAERILAPSQAAIDVYREFYPQLQIQQSFHPDWAQNAPYPAVVMRGLQAQEPFRIVVLGALSIIKGANVLEETSLLAARQMPDLEFTLAGYAYKKLNAAVTTTGPYCDESLPGILADIKPHAIWFPCTWPETYSYTLSYALEAGIPVICPNLGAFPERLKNRPASWIVDWRSSPAQWLEEFRRVREEFSEQAATHVWLQQPDNPWCYLRDYAQAVSQPVSRGAVSDWNTLMARWLGELPRSDNINRRIFRLLVWLHCHPVFGSLAEMIPLKLRRSIKRRLSPRPLHE